MGERSEPHTGGGSVEISRDIIYIYRGMSVVCQIHCVGGITWPTRMLKVIFGQKKLTCDSCVIDLD